MTSEPTLRQGEAKTSKPNEPRGSVKVSTPTLEPQGSVKTSKPSERPGSVKTSKPSEPPGSVKTSNSLRRRDGWLTRIWRRLRGGRLSRKRAMGSVAVGLFIGCLPLYGLHLPLCLLVCLPLRLDVVTAYLAANISNPLFAPFLLTLEVQVGALLLDGRAWALHWEAVPDLNASGVMAQAAVGSVVVGSALALLGLFITAAVVRKPGPEAERIDAARKRTAKRYSKLHGKHRYYVAAKLSSDPLVEVLAGLSRLGAVVDAGCGRGQFGLFLLELGSAQSLYGFDWDAPKIAAATAAAGDAAQFVEAELPPGAFRRADTILLIDVLQYLESADQVAVLSAAVAHLKPGGRLVIRDLDGASLRNRAALRIEAIALRLGINRGKTLRATAPEALLTRLRQLGLSCDAGDASSSLGHRVVIATRAEECLQRPSSESAAAP